MLVSTWVSAQQPTAVLRRIALFQRKESRRRAVCCGPAVAFLRPLCSFSAQRVVASVGLQEPSLFACSSGWRVPCSLSLTCAPLPAWTSLVLCHVPSDTHCSVIIHVATKKGWVSKPRVSEEVKGEIDFPLPLPAPQTHQEVFLTCRLRTSLNNTRGWERARAWSHP